MSKRILSIILAISLLPVFFINTATAAEEVNSEYDASIFGENAEYLLEEHFSEAFLFQMNEENYRRPSGWDVDYRGGRITTSGYLLQLLDESTTEEISLKREILPVKSGTVTFETAVTFSSAANAEFSLILGDEENPMLNLLFTKQNVYNVTYRGNDTLTNIKAHLPIYIKAEISMEDKNIKLSIDNADANANDYEGTLNFTNDTSEFKNIAFHTGKTSAIQTKLHYANVYRNFLVNEKFLSDPIGDVPNGFTLSQTGTGSGIADAPGSTYKDDENGFLLKNTADIPGIALTKSFKNSNTKITASWAMLMPEIQNGFYTRITSEGIAIATIYTGGGKLFANGKLAESSLIPNLWYTVSADIDTVAGTYDLQLNKRTVLTDIPLYTTEIPSTISFSKEATGTVGEVIIDDIEIIPTFEKYADYPTAPVKASSDGVDTGMVMYPMWREGMHYGWDTISPYADERKPIMGYYTEGQVEVADWQNKWLAEHGIDYAIYPFVRPSEYLVNATSVGEPIKTPVRSEDLMDGYMNSYYKDDVKFAIMLSQWGGRYKDANDFVTYAVPYIKEYFFRNPNYMKINNKLPIYCYSIGQMSTAFGGTSGMQTVLDALDAAAKELGYDGIIFGADAATGTGHTTVNNINRDYVRIWNYTKETGNVNALKTHIDSEYNYSSSFIPSISTGFDDTPWRESTSEMMSASDVKELCQYVEDHASFKAETEKMVLFTCWNEYGEGHFFSPSSKEGFGYLNAIRDVFTASGEKTNEESPSALSVARMEALYPNGRGALKFLKDKEYSDTDIASREVLYRYDFTADSAKDGWFTNSNCTVSHTDNGVKGTTKNINPWIQCELGDTGVALDDVRACKIKVYQKGAANMQVFYHTTGYDNGENPGVNEYGEFFSTEAISGNSEYGEYILHFNSEAKKMTGNISMIKLRFGDNVHSSGGKEFGVEYFELLGDPKTVEPIAKIDLGAPDATGNCTVEVQDDTIVATATGTDPQLRYTSVSETIDMSKVKSIKVRAYTQNTNDLTVFYGTDGNVTYQHSPYKFVTSSVTGDGSFREYILTHDDLGTNASPTGNITSIRIDPNDNIIDGGGHFGIDWIEFYEEELYDETYPITLNIEGQKYETSSPIQEKSKVAYVPVYSMLLREFDSYVVWDEPTKTLTVEKGENKISTTVGSKVATVNGREVNWNNAPYYEKGNIYVPADDFFYAMGYAVDYVPEFRTINCSTLVENLLFNVSAKQVQYDNIAFDFWNDTNGNAYYINGTSINGNNLDTITETVDGEDAIKIEPPSGAGNDALFVCRGLSNNGQYMRFANFVAEGTKMKVSFSYRGVGSAFEVEIRDGNRTKVVQAPNPELSSTEWRTFEYVFDNSEASFAEMLTLRLKSTAGTTPYLYVKDFEVSRPEEKTITEYTNDGNIEFTLEIPTGSRQDIPYACYLAEYDGNELVNFVVVKEGNTRDAGEYTTKYEYTPKTGNTIKLLMWNGLETLCNGLNLTKVQ